MCRDDLTNRCEAPDGDDQSGAAAEKREQQALDEHLPDQTAPSRADGGADSELLLAAGRTGEQKRRDIGARYQEHESHGAEQHEQCDSRVADERVAHRPQIRSVSGVFLWEVVREPLPDDRQLVARLFERHAGPAAGDCVEEVRRP